MKKGSYSIEQDINKKIEKVVGTMIQAGMSLTKEEEEMLKKCILKKSTYEVERQKIINQNSDIYD